jgi:8-oxo-dGTP pyrophosphatase MutT (NUDIX family)
VQKWTFLEKIQRIIAKYGGFYLIRVYWKITKHKKSRARAIILNSDKSKILLAKNITYKEFHLPGGGIEKGEDGKEAILREVQEELGIQVEIIYLLGKYVYQNTNKYVEVFVTQTTSNTFKMQWELDDAQWFPFTNLPDLGKATKQVLRDFLAHNEPVKGIWGLDS